MNNGLPLSTSLKEDLEEKNEQIKSVPERRKEQEKPQAVATELQSTENEAAKSNRFSSAKISAALVLYSLIVSVGGVLGGYSHGFPSPALVDLQEEYEADKRITSFPSGSVYAGLFAAIGPIGALFGGLTSGPVSDRLGRSMALVLMTIPHLIGWLVQAYAHWVPDTDGFIVLLLVGRWFTGFGTGWGSLVITVFLVEISPTNVKGLFGSVFWFSTTIGILLVYGLGAIPGFPYYHLSLSTAALVLPCITLYCFLPETPRWLVAHGRVKEARKILKHLRGSNADISEELRELQENITENKQVSFWKNLKFFSQRSAYVPLILSVLLMFFQQFTGTNVVVFYAGAILTNARVVNAKEVAGYAVGATQVLMTFISVLLIDCVGRKILLVLSSILVCASTGLLGLYYFLTDYVCEHYYNIDPSSSINLTGSPIFCDPVHSKFYGLAIFSIMLFIVAFSTGWATIPWVMMSELSPLRVRGTLSGIATTVNWTTAAFLTGVFPIYQNVVHHYGSWWTLTAITLVSIPFVVIFVPETKGESLEQIEEHLRMKNLTNTISPTDSDQAYGSTAYR